MLLFQFVFRNSGAWRLLQVVGSSPSQHTDSAGVILTSDFRVSHHDQSEEPAQAKEM